VADSINIPPDGWKRGEKFAIGIIAVDNVNIAASGKKFSLGGAVIVKSAVRFNVFGCEVGQRGRFKADKAVAMLRNTFGTYFHHRITAVFIGHPSQKFLQDEPSGHRHPRAIFPNAAADPEFY
jgi:hypothetical protein